jgi:hypothetical protein
VAIPNTSSEYWIHRGRDILQSSRIGSRARKIAPPVRTSLCNEFRTRNTISMAAARWPICFRMGLIDRDLIDRNLIDRDLIDRNLIDRNLIDRNMIDRNMGHASDRVFDSYEVTHVAPISPATLRCCPTCGTMRLHWASSPYAAQYCQWRSRGCRRGKARGQHAHGRSL